MAPIEWQAVSPEEMVRELEQTVQRFKENKYAFQNGLKDLDFDIDPALMEAFGLSTPFYSIDLAEQALSRGAIRPAMWLEHDDTRHQVLVFDPRPVGYSGFMNCVTHSIALTDLGLFEVGRYPAVSLESPGKLWSWFLHRRLATPDEVRSLLDTHHWTAEEFAGQVYRALTGLDEDG